MSAAERARLALRLAVRDLRGGFVGLPIFLACLAIGVAAIAGVGSLSDSILNGLQADARVLLGGEVELRRTHRPIDRIHRDWLAARGGRLSDTVQMRAMATASGATATGATALGAGDRALVELKAVDPAYPLFGAVTLEPPSALADALADRGAVVDPALLTRLAIKIGDRITIGDAAFTVRATIPGEPDRLATAFSFGPRVMIAMASLPATGLVQPGSLIRYHTRIALPEAASIADFVADLEAAFPAADWRLRDARNAQPGFRGFVNRLSMYLILVGLTALLVGGIGVAGAVRGHVDSRQRTVAILKCLGAPAFLVFQIYLLQVLLVGLVGTALGLALGAGLPLLAVPLLAGEMPVDPQAGVYLRPLLLAGLFGVLTALTAALWPLARTQGVPAGSLFRQAVLDQTAWPKRGYRLALLAMLAVLAGLAIYSAGRPIIGVGFVAGALLTVLVFQAAAWALLKGLGTIAGRLTGRHRLALANLVRPGAGTGAVMLSLGVGLTVLVAIALIEGNLQSRISDRLPETVPSFFFVDIQPDQIDGFRETVRQVDGVGGLETVPMVRGRIISINGAPVAEAEIGSGARWVVRSDIGFTFAGPMPPRTDLVAGAWWPADYQGPPLISFDAEAAAGMGVGVGDRLGFNILGRTIAAEIGNLRAIDWNNFGINFVVIFAPGALESAPHSHIATAQATARAEAPLIRAIGERFGNVSAIPVRNMIETVNRIVTGVATALRITAAVTLIAGMLVLAGVIAAERRRRLFDSVVLKVLGASRAMIARSFVIEFAVLGVLSAAIAAVLGTLGAWIFVTRVMEDPWQFLPGPVLVTLLVAVAATVAVGVALTWRALGQKPMPVLRTE